MAPTYASLLPAAAGATTSGPYDTGTAQASVSLQVTATAAAYSVQLQSSADAAAWANAGSPATSPGTTPITVTARYFRAVVSGFTGPGSVTVALGYTAATGYTGGAATGGAPGAVELTGDLAGTATSPQVTGTHLASPLPVIQGGIGSSTRNFAGLLTPVAAQTSAYTAAAGDFVPVDTTSGNVTVTLPGGVTPPPDLTVVAVKHVIQGVTSGVPNTVSVVRNPAGTDVFNKAGGGTSLTLSLASQGAVLQYKASGGIWYVTADDLPLGQLDSRYAQLAGNLAGVASKKTARANIGAHQIINVRDYGAVPDGTTDNLAFLNAALADAAMTAGTYLQGGTELSPRIVLYFPAGTGSYGIKNSPLILPNYVTVKGDSLYSTSIKQLTAGQDTIQVNPGGYQGTGATTRADTGCGTFINAATVTDTAAVSGDLGHTVTGAGIPLSTYITAVSGGNITLSNNATASGTATLTVSLFDDGKIGVTMRDISIFGAGQGSGSGAGVAFKAYNTPQMRFDAVRFSSAGSHAFQANYSWDLYFNQCIFGGAGGNGVELLNQCNVANFDNCMFVSNTGHGFHLKTGAACTINNGDVESNGQHGVYLETSFAFSLRGTDFENNNTSNGGYANLYVGSSSTAAGPTVEHNNFSGAGTAANGIVVDTALNTIIKGNEFTSATRSANHASCTTTNASPTVSDATATSADLWKIVTGTGIPAGTYITAVAGGNITLSQNATASGTVTLAVFGADILINSGATGTQLQGNTTVNANLLVDNGASTCHIGKRLVSGVVALTDAATIAVDASLGNVFKVTLGGNRTLGNPTSPVSGQKILVEVTQDATGSRTLAYAANYAFSTDLPSPVLSTAANAVDYLKFIYNATAGKWRLIGLVQGF